MVITKPFVLLVQATAVNLGVAAFPVLVAEHPIWTREPAWIDAAAEALCGPLIGKLFANKIPI